MQWHDVEQNSDEWDALRVGKLTASSFSVIMAHYPKAFGDPAQKLAVQLAFERLVGESMTKHYGGGYMSKDMERGHIEESIARALYEDEKFCAVTNGGFFCNDFIGCSPDGLIDEVGGLEIKSVLPQTHAATKRRGSFDPAYKWQVIGNLAHTGREWWDFVSFCSFAPPEHQLLIYRVYSSQYTQEIDNLLAREREFIELIKQEMEFFK